MRWGDTEERGTRVCFLETFPSYHGQTTRANAARRSSVCAAVGGCGRLAAAAASWIALSRYAA
eukprot:4389447-Lingulodinium_polyedra.AAC.1